MLQHAAVLPSFSWMKIFHCAHPPMGGHLGAFHLSAAVNGAGLPVQAPECLLSPLRGCPEGGAG